MALNPAVMKSMRVVGGVVGCEPVSWLGGVGCGLSSAFECVGPGCGRCGPGVWVVLGRASKGGWCVGWEAGWHVSVVVDQ